MKRLLLFLSLMASVAGAQEKNSDAFSYFQQLYFENSEHQYDPYLLKELPSLLESPPSHAQTDEILWMLASTEEWNGFKYKALLNYYKILL